MTTYNTNLAAEFHVLSVLYRLGTEASLTLGNKKSVDILVALPDGSTLTLDVKGLAGPYDWPSDNIGLPAPKSHFIALLSFEGRITDLLHSPNMWLIPANALSPCVKEFRRPQIGPPALPGSIARDR
jgi:hypothetical protein